MTTNILNTEARIQQLEARVRQTCRRPNRTFRRYAEGLRYTADAQFATALWDEVQAKRPPTWADMEFSTVVINLHNTKVQHESSTRTI
jgi:hypothetical protein